MEHCLDLIGVFVSECVRQVIMIHINNGKMMLNLNN